MVDLQKVKRRITYDLATPLLGIHPKELKTITQENAYTGMFIAALITTAPKLPTCLSTGKWTDCGISFSNRNE